MDPSERASRNAVYHDLFDRMWDCVLLLDTETFNIIDVNEACERVMGQSPETLMGTTLQTHIDVSERAELEKALRISRRRHYPRGVEVHWNTPTGRQLILQFMICVLKLGDGKEVIQTIAKDVTPMKEAEEKVALYLSELKEANQKLEALSVTDELTSLANIRHFKREMAKEHERAERYGQPYSIVFCDVDYFKNYNDRCGHPAGDEVLRGVAEVIKRQCRNTDLPARYGGEEFVILCPGVNWEGAQVLAERIRARVEGTSFKDAESQPSGKLTVSIGVASFPADGKSMQDIIKSADEAAYGSKKTGRNRVTSSAELRVMSRRSA